MILASERSAASLKSRWSVVGAFWASYVLSQSKNTLRVRWWPLKAMTPALSQCKACAKPRRMDECVAMTSYRSNAGDSSECSHWNEAQGKASASM